MLTLNWGVIWIIVNILILFVLLRIFLFKPVLGMIEKRQMLIQNQLDDAESENKEADELKLRYRGVAEERERGIFPDRERGEGTCESPVCAHYR